MQKVPNSKPARHRSLRQARRNRYILHTFRRSAPAPIPQLAALSCLSSICRRYLANIEHNPIALCHRKPRIPCHLCPPPFACRLLHNNNPLVFYSIFTPNRKQRVATMVIDKYQFKIRIRLAQYRLYTIVQSPLPVMGLAQLSKILSFAPSPRPFLYIKTRQEFLVQRWGTFIIRLASKSAA